MRLLHEFDQLLPFEKLSGLSESNTASRIFQATDGLIYSIKKLIEDAAWIALKKHENCIELEHFAKAFAQNKFINEDFKGYAKTNPFWSSGSESDERGHSNPRFFVLYFNLGFKFLWCLWINYFKF